MDSYRFNLLDVLPLNYDDTTIRTIEQIDVICSRSDLLPELLKLNIPHQSILDYYEWQICWRFNPTWTYIFNIVCPIYHAETRSFRKFKGQYYSLLDRAPLYECCSYISYDSMEQLAQERHLEHLSDSVLDEYSEWAE